MTANAHYLTRPDLLAGTVRRDDDPATIRWSFDANNIYLLIRAPQQIVSDERNTDWPTKEGVSDGKRWWGSDAIQIQLATLGSLEPLPNGKPNPDGKVFAIAFKPGGVALTRVAAVKGPTLGKWSEGPTGIKYAMTTEKQDGKVKGYLIEAAIPRDWFTNGDIHNALAGPALRANVLRHRAFDLTSTSWSGPLVNDEDISMMGLLVGNQ
jgi:hypothetical protein